MAAAELPPWIAALGSIGGTGLVAAWLAWKENRRDHSSEPASAGAPAVVAASVISDAAIDKMSRIVRESAESHHDDCRRVRESNDDLRDAIRDLERAVREGLPPVAGVDIATLMARLDKLERR